MKNKYLLVILTLVLAVGLMGIPTAKAAYTLVWSDEFDGSSVNLNNWTFETGGGGWGNNELQYYTNGLNATVSGGILTITARRENYENRQYTSTRIITRGKREFKYGRIEARIQIPMGKGLWPAFWTLGANIGNPNWPACGEIDIMEHVNTETVTHGYIHWDAGSGHASYGGSTSVSNPTAWHIYAIEWDASRIRWSVDGVTFVEANILNNVNGTEEFHLPHFILLNLAVGGDWPGSPDSSTVFPAYYRVDYVRVYQDNGTPVPTATPTPPPSTTYPIPGQIEAENYSAMSGIDTESCSEGGLNVGWIESGDWMDYNVNVQSSGTYNAQYRVASTGTSGRFDLRRGSTVLGSYTVPNTGGWQSWTTVSGNVSLSSGTQTLRIYATGSGWNINWLRFSATATPTPTRAATPIPGGNLALNKPVTVSSVENAETPGSAAVDGNTGTRWSSAFSDPQWIYVDLGAIHTVNRVKLNWEAAYGRSYTIQVSTNATGWTNVYSTSTGDGGIDDLNFTATSARYVRMYGTVRATEYGYSLWEFEAYGSGSATPTPTRVATATPTPTRTPSSSVTPTPTPGGIQSWQPNTAYATGILVVYGGTTYKCLQAHTSLVGWEPPNVPALWQAQ